MRCALLLVVACGGAPVATSVPPAPTTPAPPVAKIDPCGPDAAGNTHARLAEVAGDLKTARSLYEETCGHGDGIGCYGLGTALNIGLGGPEDRPRATELFAQAIADLEKRCHDGCANTCAILAWTWHTGQGHDVDEAKSLAVMTDSCEHGSAEGCFLLSQMYEFGYGVAPDHATGDGFARKSCELGDPLGCNAVAYGYEKAKDFDGAKPFHERACKAGMKESCEAIHK